MRTIKTAVAVVLGYLVFLPLWYFFPHPTGTILDHMNPLYTCLAAVICMQSSLGQTWNQGLSRLIGTIVGGLVGILALIPDRLLEIQPLFAFMMGGAVVVSIWVCLLIRRPTACAMASVLACVILFNHVGPERYYYAISRILETAVGVCITLVVNWVLPTHKLPEQEKAPPEEGPEEEM